MTLHCYCCGEAYEKGKYRCCRPPTNMTAASWLAKHCKQCSGDPTGLRTHCPKHCTCPKAPILTPDGFSAWRDTSLAAELERKRNLEFPQLGR